MASLPNLPSASFRTMETMLLIALQAKKTILMIGDPGVGKTSIVRAVGKTLKLPVVELLGSTLDPTDVGGLPVKHVDADNRATVERIPLRVIADACSAPHILFLDELSSAPAAVQAAFLRLILDRAAGDSILHPDSVIVAACNPPEQTPGGFDLTAPLMNRMAVVKFRPTEDEVISYMRGLGKIDSTDAEERALAEEASLFSAVASVADGLLQIDLPKEAISGGIPWASPRAVETMLRLRAAATAIGIDPTDEAVVSLMAGAIGERAAITYMGILRTITELPSVDEIIADPEKALLPTEKAKQIAALGLMTRIATKNLYAAYIYAARMTKEFGLAAHKSLLPLAKHTPPPTDPLTKKGIQARASLSALVGGPKARA